MNGKIGEYKIMDNAVLNYTDIMHFYQGKRVLITGHTGFKGSWMTKILLNAGAIVMGYSLDIPTVPNLFSISGIAEDKNLINVFDDIRNYEKLSHVVSEFKPQIIFHLAAQPIVRDSYKNPVYTYSTNVMGTVNILEAIRVSLDVNSRKSVVKSFVNVTTDKVYCNNEWVWGYRENEPLDGFDPYSNSKSCSELVTHSYKNSFFFDDSVAISTARAGNVIGGGDFAKDRIIPDSLRVMEAAWKKGALEGIIGVRNPYSVRPYQHVLEPLFVYLTIAARQYDNIEYAGYYNVGPDDIDCITTGELVDLFCSEWNNIIDGYPAAKWKNIAEFNAPHEASFLKLDCSKIKSVFGWKPRWHIEECVKKTVIFSKIWLSGGNVTNEMDEEIQDFIVKH